MGILEGLSTDTLWLIAGVTLGAYLVRGISGFGSSLLAVPIVAQILPLTFIVPCFTVMDAAASSALARVGGRAGHIRWDEIRRLLIPSFGGILLGIVALKRLPEAWLLLPLGLFVAAFGLRTLLQRADQRRISAWWAFPAGLAGGAVDALFATGGPPFVIYLSHRIRDKSRLRATLSALFLIEGAARAASFLVLGMLWSPEMGIALLCGLPLLALGLHLGHRVHLGISQGQMAVVVGLLLVTSGSSILVRALW